MQPHLQVTKKVWLKRRKVGVQKGRTFTVLPSQTKQARAKRRGSVAMVVNAPSFLHDPTSRPPFRWFPPFQFHTPYRYVPFIFFLGFSYWAHWIEFVCVVAWFELVSLVLGWSDHCSIAVLAGKLALDLIALVIDCYICFVLLCGFALIWLEC